MTAIKSGPVQETGSTSRKHTAGNLAQEATTSAVYHDNTSSASTGLYKTDVDRLIMQLGIHYRPMPSSASDVPFFKGFLIQSTLGRWIIAVGNHATEAQTRWTKARMLCAYIINNKMGTDAETYLELENITELEIKLEAHTAELMIPLDKLALAIAEIGIDPVGLAAAFEVPADAMSNRLNSLELIGVGDDSFSTVKDAVVQDF